MLVSLYVVPPADPGMSSAATCINVQGTIGGAVYQTLLGPGQAGATWSNAFVLTGPEMTTTAPISQILDLNDNGDAVGVWGENNTPTTHAFLIRGGALIDLAPVLPQGSQANGINNSGLITGVCGLGTNGGQGFDYNSITKAAPTLIAQLPGQSTFPISYATKLNKYGNTVGKSGNNGFMLADMLVDIGPAAFVTDINDEGVVVGSMIDPNTGNWRAVYWATSVSRFGFWEVAPPVQIPLPPGCNASQANAINNFGVIAGACLYPGGDATGSAFICYVSRGVSYDLNNFLYPWVSEQGWKLQVANDINDHNRVVGTGLLKGQTRGFLGLV